ncbi:unnamed protein product [Rotaria sp. Silwood1]|nr:unnamed protein product [Rotaria sp. Silwood1]CAF3687713.1 unnamed protein product [Rotaria sp. Silwood1]CAF3727539.1 unnamed protein product [Rotaria sp. Silwood1]CAF4565437.1 unnamed protein product [Rotaria sp. Silwood1]CAF4720302.1 unnamed protein product [Rotaria sp. Silwood1]
MNGTVSLTSLNQQNGNKICCICLEKTSVDIPIINCDHRYEFCNECIMQWFTMKKLDCPICRKVWQDKAYSDTSSQIDSHLAVSLESLSSSIIENTYQPSATYFGMFYPTISTSTTRARRQITASLLITCGKMADNNTNMVAIANSMLNAADEDDREAALRAAEILRQELEKQAFLEQQAQQVTNNNNPT